MALATFATEPKKAMTSDFRMVNASVSMLVLGGKHAFCDSWYVQSVFVKKRLVMTTRDERIREAINGSGNTPSSIADKLGCTPQAVSQWMSGETKNIKNDLLFGLEDITGYSARWIATTATDQSRPTPHTRHVRVFFRPLSKHACFMTKVCLLFSHPNGNPRPEDQTRTTE